MTVILRALELGSLEIEHVNTLQDACIPSQKQLENNVGVTTKKELQVFDLPIHMLLHLQFTILRCFREYWYFPLESVVKKLKGFSQANRHTGVSLIHKLGSRIMSHLLGSRDLEDDLIVNYEVDTTGSYLEEICIRKNHEDSSFQVNHDSIKMVREEFKEEFSAAEINVLLFFNLQKYEVRGKRSDAAFRTGSIIKMYCGETSRDPKHCNRLLLVSATPDGEDSSTKHFVLLQESKTFPLIKRSQL